MVKRRDKTEKRRSLLGAIILYLLISIFFSIVAIFSWVSYFNQYEIAEIIDKDIKVMATLTEIRWKSGPGTGSGFWTIWYEFTDNDGTHYEGRYSYHNISRRDEAEAQIGKQVEIFIDGQGNSVLMRERPDDFTYYLVWAIIFTILAGAVVIFIITKEILIIKKKSFIKKMRG